MRRGMLVAQRAHVDFDLIVKGGTVVTGIDSYRADVGVAGGKVAALGIDLGTAPRMMNAAGKYALPVAIDVHTHFEMPFMGTFTADDFRTGTAAAASPRACAAGTCRSTSS